MSTHDAEIDARNETIRIWVNGALRAEGARRRVSVYDSGFMLGDGVWEGLRLYAGRWAFLDDHLDRLFEAARAIDLDIGMDRAGVAAALEETRAANGMKTDAHARLMVTRGRKARPFQHPKLSRFGPTVVIIMEHSVPAAGPGARRAARHGAAGARPADEPGPEAEQPLQAQLRARLHPGREGRRRRGADARPARLCEHHERLQLLHRAPGRGLDLDRRLLHERDHPRAKVIELCRANGIPVHVRNFSLVETYGAEEAFLTGTFGGQTPVAELDGRVYGDGAAGPVTRRIQGLYNELIARG